MSGCPCTSSRYTVLGTGIIYEMGHSGQHFHIPVQLIGKQRQKQVVRMVDSSTTTTFISQQFVVENCVAMRKSDRPILLYNINGTLNCDGTISDVAILELQVGEHCEHAVFMVTDIGAKDVTGCTSTILTSIGMRGHCTCLGVQSRVVHIDPT